MHITVEMIETKEFKTKVRGYDPAEVDEFLDAICDEMVAMEEQIEVLTQRLAEKNANQVRPVKAEPVPAPVAQPVAQPVAAAPSMLDREKQETLSSLLINAQKVADQTVAEAHARAEAILADAQKKADTQLATLTGDRTSLIAEVESLKKAAADYKARFVKLIQDQQKLLADTELFK